MGATPAISMILWQTRATEEQTESGQGGTEERVCKTFRKLHRVAGRGRAADPGGQTRATGAPCVPPLSASVSSGRYLHAEQDPPLPRPGGEGAEPRAKMGEGKAGPPCLVRRRQRLQVLF